VTFVDEDCVARDPPIEVPAGVVVRAIALCEVGSCYPDGEAEDGHVCESDFEEPERLELRADDEDPLDFVAMEARCDISGRSRTVYAVVPLGSGEYRVAAILGGAAWETTSVPVSVADAGANSEGGCSQTPGAAPTWALLSLAALLRRRR